MADKKNAGASSSPKKVQHTFTAANGSASSTEKPPVNATPAAPAEGKAGAGKYRIGAIALWLVALVFEVIAVLVLFEKLHWTFLPQLAIVIIALVLDLACVIVGSQLWKKSNRLDPASEKDKVKFWLWNNMGVIASVLAFVPFIILALTNKNADKKTKAIATVVAVIALLVGGLCSYDWNPISQEQKESEMAQYTQTVYWTKSGTVYHLNPDCSHLNHSEELFYGDVEQAIEANKTRVCKDCEKKYNAEIESGEREPFEGTTEEATAEFTVGVDD